MSYTKENAIKIVVTCAEKYRLELENKNLLFICIDKHKNSSYMKFAFHDYNFMHLTGLKTPQIKPPGNNVPQNALPTEQLSAIDFYNRCLEHKLSVRDFEFANDGTTSMKLDVLPFIICKNLAANMIGDFKSYHPRLYTEKIAGSSKAYIGFVKDIISKEYVPNTVVKDDLRKNVTDYVRVVAAYRKDIQDTKYEERTYLAKKVDWSNIKFPPEFAYLPKPE